MQAILTKCDDTSKIPNQEQRQSTSTALRGVASDASTLGCTNFLTLASYIESSFAEEKIESMKKMAGGAYLEEARGSNWASATTMNSMVLTFIKTYGADLTKGDMPDIFPAKCTSDSAAYDTALTNYENNKGTAGQQTQDRINGFNKVYASLRGIMKDGKLIYRDDVTTRRQFTYSVVLAKVTKNKRFGFRFQIADGVTKLRVVTVNVQSIQGKWLFKANKKGVIFAKVPEGDYTGTITAPGYQSVTVTLTSNKGVVHCEDILLTPIMVAATVTG